MIMDCNAEGICKEVAMDYFVGIIFVSCYQQLNGIWQRDCQLWIDRKTRGVVVLHFKSNTWKYWEKHEKLHSTAGSV
jgi:hypothetical protein